MSEIINLLTAIRDKIGYESFLFIILSLVTLVFSDHLSEKVPAPLQVTVKILAGILFAVGLLIALLRISSSYFTLRPARGMVDGLASGLVAGLIGGYFGYGFHSGSQYPVHPLLRTILCVPFAVAIGGVLGLSIDLYHPDRTISWRKYLSALILSFAMLVALVGVGLFTFVPAFPGAGITLSDIQLIFEVGLLVMISTIAFSFGWQFEKYLARLPLALFCIAVARLISFLVIIKGPSQAIIRLGQRQYLSGIEGGVELAFSAIILMLWFIATYGFFYLNHPIARRLERLFTPSRRSQLISPVQRTEERRWF